MRKQSQANLHQLCLLLLSGYVIGYKRYYDGVIKVISKVKVFDTSDQTSSQAGDKLVELFENFQDMAIEETPDGLTFIHLEKSVVVNDSSGNLLAPSYWRLKIDTIDGFMLGMPQSMVET